MALEKAGEEHFKFMVCCGVTRLEHGNQRLGVGSADDGLPNGALKIFKKFS